MSGSLSLRVNRFVSFRWLLVLVTVVVFFIASIAVAYRSIGVMAENSRDINHTLHTIALIKDLKSSLLAAEGAHLGYLLTADEDYLEPYRQALGSVSRLLETLRGTTQHLPLQKSRIEELYRRTQNKIDLMSIDVTLVASDQRAAFNRDRRMELMASITKLIQEMEADELWLLNNNRSLAENNQRLIMAALIATNVLGLLLALGIYLIVYRNSNKVTSLYRQIEHANELLEYKVEERTLALKRYSDELQRSNRELEDFAFVASHDLQEPLRKIRAFGDRLVQRYGASLGVRGQDYIERMCSASDRMSLLIDDLLSFSRVTTRQNMFQQIDLNKTVGRVLEDLDYAVDIAQAEVRVDPLPVVEGDELQFFQLFSNLIVNSLKFKRNEVPAKISISCEIGPQCNVESDDREWCCIRVQDNGIGFEREYSEKVFSLFQRLHGRQEYSGTGIGLALCRKIVNRHSGTISVDSELGRGTCFTIKLPLTQTELEVFSVSEGVIK